MKKFLRGVEDEKQKSEGQKIKERTDRAEDEHESPDRVDVPAFGGF